MISLGRRMVWSMSAKSAHSAKAGLSSGRKSGASSRGRSPASGHSNVCASASWLSELCLGAPIKTAFMVFLAVVFLGAAPTLAADNFAINNATGTFTVLSCAESAGVCTLRVQQLPTTTTDCSGTITLGGTAQSICGGTQPTNGFAIANPSDTDMWISDSTVTPASGTAGSIRVAANGGYYATEPGQKPLGAVYVLGATTGKGFTARRW